MAISLAPHGSSQQLNLFSVNKMVDAIITALSLSIIGLVSYIFLSTQKNIQDRFRAMDDRFKHTESLIEEMVKNNTRLGNIIQNNDYRLDNVETKLKIKRTQKS